jgi:hypothetical protein
VVVVGTQWQVEQEWLLQPEQPPPPPAWDAAFPPPPMPNAEGRRSTLREAQAGQPGRGEDPLTIVSNRSPHERQRYS